MPAPQPESQPVQEPVLEAEKKLPQEIPEIAQPATQTEAVPTDCKGFCEWECERDSHNACNQKDRSGCKALCGATIDPSACSQACSFISQPSACRSQMESFCKASCPARCH